MDDVKRRAQERIVLSEREMAAEAQRRQIGSYSGERVTKIAARTQADDRQQKQRVAAYCRVSTDDIDQVISIELQKEEYQKKIRNNPDWQYMGTYVDDGFSGTNTTNRPGFRLMMQAAMEGRLDVIITKSVSRFARNLLDCIGWVTRLQEAPHPVKVLFEMEGIDTLATTSNLILTILAVVAEEESHMKSEAILLSLEWRFSRGRFLTPRLFGYDTVNVPDGYGGYRKILQPVEAEARVVRWIYERVIAGAALEDIAATLTEMNIPTGGRKRNKTINTTWTDNRVTSLVRNERYCGDVLGRKTYTPNFKTHRSVKNNGKKNKYFQSGHHEAIVSRAVWNAAQRILNSRRYRHGGSYLPMRIVQEGPLTGYISMNPKWAGYTAEDYFRMCNVAMGLEEGSMTEDLENEYLPEAGHRLDGLMDEQGIQRIARKLTAEEQAIREKLDGQAEGKKQNTPEKRSSFQLIGAEMFTQTGGANLIIRPSSISFNRMCTEYLPDCEGVELLLNPVERALVVRPCQSDNPNAIEWKMTFGATCVNGILYEIMGWDESYSYKLRATPRENGEERVLYFDMDNYIGRSLSKAKEEPLKADREDMPRATAETRGFYYAPDENEPQSMEEIQDMEEKLKRIRQEEYKSFGEPAFQYFVAEVDVLPGEGSLMAEAKPICEAPAVDPDKTAALLGEIRLEPPVYNHGKQVESGMKGESEND